MGPRPLRIRSTDPGVHPSVCSTAASVAGSYLVLRACSMLSTVDVDNPAALANSARERKPRRTRSAVTAAATRSQPGSMGVSLSATQGNRRLHSPCLATHGSHASHDQPCWLQQKEPRPPPCFPSRPRTLRRTRPASRLSSPPCPRSPPRASTPPALGVVTSRVGVLPRERGGQYSL